MGNTKKKIYKLDKKFREYVIKTFREIKSSDSGNTTSRIYSANELAVEIMLTFYNISDYNKSIYGSREYSTVIRENDPERCNFKVLEQITFFINTKFKGVSYEIPVDSDCNYISSKSVELNLPDFPVVEYCSLLNDIKDSFPKLSAFEFKKLAANDSLKLLSGFTNLLENDLKTIIAGSINKQYTNRVSDTSESNPWLRQDGEEYLAGKKKCTLRIDNDFLNKDLLISLFSRNTNRNTEKRSRESKIKVNHIQAVTFEFDLSFDKFVSGDLAKVVQVYTNEFYANLLSAIIHSYTVLLPKSVYDLTHLLDRRLVHNNKPVKYLLAFNDFEDFLYLFSPDMFKDLLGKFQDSISLSFPAANCCILILGCLTAHETYAGQLSISPTKTGDIFDWGASNVPFFKKLYYKDNKIYYLIEESYFMSGNSIPKKMKIFKITLPKIKNSLNIYIALEDYYNIKAILLKTEEQLQEIFEYAQNDIASFVKDTIKPLGIKSKKLPEK